MSIIFDGAFFLVDIINGVAPWCVLAKVTLMALGTCGLWATRSLYGDRQVRSAQHQRMR